MDTELHHYTVESSEPKEPWKTLVTLQRTAFEDLLGRLALQQTDQDLQRVKEYFGLPLGVLSVPDALQELKARRIVSPCNVQPLASFYKQIGAAANLTAVENYWERMDVVATEASLNTVPSENMTDFTLARIKPSVHLADYERAASLAMIVTAIGFVGTTWINALKRDITGIGVIIRYPREWEDDIQLKFTRRMQKYINSTFHIQVNVGVERLRTEDLIHVGGFQPFTSTEELWQTVAKEWKIKLNPNTTPADVASAVFDKTNKNPMFKSFEVASRQMAQADSRPSDQRKINVLVVGPESGGKSSLMRFLCDPTATAEKSMPITAPAGSIPTLERLYIKPPHFVQLDGKVVDLAINVLEIPDPIASFSSSATGPLSIVSSTAQFRDLTALRILSDMDVINAVIICMPFHYNEATVDLSPLPQQLIRHLREPFCAVIVVYTNLDDREMSESTSGESLASKVKSKLAAFNSSARHGIHASHAVALNTNLHKESVVDAIEYLKAGRKLDHGSVTNISIEARQSILRRIASAESVPVGHTSFKVPHEIDDACRDAVSAIEKQLTYLTMTAPSLKSQMDAANQKVYDARQDGLNIQKYCLELESQERDLCGTIKSEPVEEGGNETVGYFFSNAGLRWISIPASVSSYTIKFDCWNCTVTEDTTTPPKRSKQELQIPVLINPDSVSFSTIQTSKGDLTWFARAWVEYPGTEVNKSEITQIRVQLAERRAQFEACRSVRTKQEALVAVLDERLQMCLEKERELRALSKFLSDSSYKISELDDVLIAIKIARTITFEGLQSHIKEESIIVEQSVFEGELSKRHGAVAADDSDNDDDANDDTSGDELEGYY